MSPQQQIIDWLQQDAERMLALRTARSLELNDWCLGAGFVRNLVWDRIYGNSVATPLNDIDVVYFDSQYTDVGRDQILEMRLFDWLPKPWSVKNQARMHLRNQHAPYLNTEEAMSYWPEIETAVGARLNVDNQVELIAPFGLEALFNGSITFNLKNGDLSAFKRRVEAKQWLQQWPKLKVRVNES